MTVLAATVARPHHIGRITILAMIVGTVTAAGGEIIAAVIAAVALLVNTALTAWIVGRQHDRERETENEE